MPETVDVKTAAAILGVNKATVYEAIKRGDAPFPVIRVGDRILIPRRALERLTDGAPSIDVEAARRHLRETLPADQPVEIADDGVLDAAAAVVVRTKAAAP